MQRILVTLTLLVIGASGASARPLLGNNVRTATRAAAQDRNQRSPAESVLYKFGTQKITGQVLADFVENGTVPKGQTFPAWKQFSAIVGHEQPARQRYAEMLRLDAQLLAAYAKNPKKAVQLFEARLDAATKTRGIIGPERKNPGPEALAETTLLFLVAGNKRIQLQGELAFPLYSLVFEHRFVPERKSQEYFAMEFSRDPIFQKVLRTWVTKPSTHPTVLIGQIGAASIFGLREGIVPAKSAFGLKDFKEFSKWPGIEKMYRRIALSVLVPIATQEDLKFLEPLLEDDASVGIDGYMSKGVAGQPDFDRKSPEMQVRDIALAALVQMSGQKLEDYYLTKENYSGIPCYFFEDAGHREPAIIKWRTWAKENLKQDLPAKSQPTGK